jgi:uncharacterized coiled-coil protein SlyX
MLNEREMFNRRYCQQLQDEWEANRPSPQSPVDEASTQTPGQWNKEDWWKAAVERMEMLERRSQAQEAHSAHLHRMIADINMQLSREVAHRRWLEARLAHQQTQFPQPAPQQPPVQQPPVVVQVYVTPDTTRVTANRRGRQVNPVRPRMRGQRR